MTQTPAPRAAVVYESMFGNTASVATAVADGLRSGGVDAVVTDVARMEVEPALDADLLVVGAPTHAFSLSRPSTRADAVRQGADADRAAVGLREWLAAASRAEGRPPVATFDTRVDKVRRLHVAAASAATRLLRRAGFPTFGRSAAFVVEDVSGPLGDGELVRATAWGRDLAAALLGQRLPRRSAG